MDTLVAEGVPDFKLFTAYPGVFFSDDGAIFRAMQQTAQERRADHDARRERPGHRRRGGRRPSPPARPTRSATASPATRSSRARRPTASSAWPRRPGCPSTSSTCRRARRSTRSATARDRGAHGLRRDLPAVPVPVARRPGQRLRGRQVRLLAAAPADGPPGRALDRPASRTTSRSSRPTTARSTSTARRSSGGATSARSRTACPASRTGSTCSTTAASSAAGSRRERWVEIISTAPAKLFGMYPRKGAIAVGSDADLVVYDPNRKRTISATTHHMDVDYSCYEGRDVQGGQRRRPVARHGRSSATASSPGGRATAGSSSAARPTTPGSPDRAATHGDRDTLPHPGRAGPARRTSASSSASAADEAAAPRRLRSRPGPGGRRGGDQRHRPRPRRPPRLGRGRPSALEGDRFVVTLEDDAPAFDPTTVPEPDLSVRPGQRRPGGMGVLLARLCVDEIEPSAAARRRQHTDPGAQVRSRREGGSVDGAGDHRRAGSGARARSRSSRSTASSTPPTSPS